MSNLSFVNQCCSSKVAGVSFFVVSSVTLVPSVALPVLMAVGIIPKTLGFTAIPVVTSIVSVATASLGIRNIFCKSSPDDHDTTIQEDNNAQTEIPELDKSKIKKELITEINNLSKLISFYKHCCNNVHCNMSSEVKDTAIKQIFRYQSLLLSDVSASDLTKTSFDRVAYDFYSLCLKSVQFDLNLYKNKYLAPSEINSHTPADGTGALKRDTEKDFYQFCENLLELFLILDENKTNAPDDSIQVAAIQIDKYICKLTNGVDYPVDLSTGAFSNTRFNFFNLVTGSFDQDLDNYKKNTIFLMD